MRSLQHADMLWFSGGAPDSLEAQAPPVMSSGSSVEPEPERLIPEGVPADGDRRYVEARLLGAVDGELWAKLFEMHKTMYSFVEPDAVRTFI
jgi:hypothetical protein